MNRPTARKKNLQARRIGDEFVIYDRKSHAAHRLNPMVAYVWQLSDGASTEDQITASVAQRFGIENAQDTVKLALVELSKLNLMEGATPVADVSRRQFVRQMGMAAGVAALVPMVDSIALSRSASAEDNPKCSANHSASVSSHGTSKANCFANLQMGVASLAARRCAAHSCPEDEGSCIPKGKPSLATVHYTHTPETSRWDCSVVFTTSCKCDGNNVT